MKRFPWVLLLLIIITISGCGVVGEMAPAGEELKAEKRISVAPSPTPVRGEPEDVLLGMYPTFLLQRTMHEFERFDRWIEPTGKKLSIAATFLDFEDPDIKRRVPAEMQAAWKAGYVPFVNLSAGNIETSWTAEEIADGELDPQIRNWARAYARWARAGQRRAFIAPLQEMNGYWVTYGGDPEHFKQAYARIQDIFREEGVPSDSVSWVFSPNGWSDEGHEFERYYPGDSAVDVVGFNSFNFGTCSSWPKWETYDDIYAPYLVRLRNMAPDKPIFISSMGTVAEGGDRGQWLLDTYRQMVDVPNLRAILYFNRWETRESLPGCPDQADYRIFNSENEEGVDGFREAISAPEFKYYPPGSPAMGELMFGTRLRR